jgi:hypothetical protein
MNILFVCLNSYEAWSFAKEQQVALALNILGNNKVPYKELIHSLHIELKAQQEMCWKQFLASKHMQRV